MKIVIALGGNALGIDPNEQIKNVNLTSKFLIPLIKNGHELIITHGNGPQVGLIDLAFSEGKKINPKVYPMSFSSSGAMSQGYIGSHLVNSLRNEMLKNNINKDVVMVLTHVEVDKNDPSFLNPTKPIGSFYTKVEADKLPYVMKEDAGRGYRRVVPSPLPIKILENRQILDLSNNGNVVIACGGGGIPVIKNEEGYEGIDAVIDKDYASSLLATSVNADMLLILTNVENAKIHFNTPLEEALHKVSLKSLNEYLQNNEFKEGSMKPKIKACLDFVSNNDGKIAIITNIENAYNAVYLKNGTIISK